MYTFSKVPHIPSHKQAGIKKLSLLVKTLLETWRGTNPLHLGSGFVVSLAKLS